MGRAAANGAVIGADGTIIQTAAVKDLHIGVVHQMVGYIQTVFVTVKAVTILHYEFAAPHQTETGTAFVAVFVLDLIDHQRQLFIGFYFVQNKACGNFFMGGPKAEISAVTVFDTPHFIAVYIPASAGLP